MSKASIVVDLMFGDGGKGITTDYLSSFDSNNTIVVRYSGGQQAGHNVKIGNVSHIHASYGSGTLRGVPSFFTEHCTVSPVAMYNEYKVLKSKGVTPELYIHPLAKVTTPYDVAYNRMTEKINHHGSCGMGIGATMKRHNETGFKLFAIDISNPVLLAEKLKQINIYYCNKLKQICNTQEYANEYWKKCEIETKYFFEAIRELNIITKPYKHLKNYDNIIFEGSQGILLDMDHGIFPHVTFANTTSKNAIEICKLLRITDVDLYYITRCYQTRHGNGWMSNNDPIELINTEDEINVTNEWQKSFRIGELDYELLNYSLELDKIYSPGYKYNRNLVITCLDQRPDFKFDVDKLNTKFKGIYNSYGPDSKTITCTKFTPLTINIY